MNDKLIINRVSILRKGLEAKTYLLPSITDILADGSIKSNHIDWTSVKSYLDALYETKDDHNLDINNLESRLITLSIDNNGDLEYSGQKFLNVRNYDPTNTDGLAGRVTALETNVGNLLNSVNSINTTLSELPNTYANKNHTHSFSEILGITEDNGYLSIGENNNKFVEILSEKLIELNAQATEGGLVYITPKVRSGEKAILVAEPDAGKKFLKWTRLSQEISTNAIHILNNPLSGDAYIGVFTNADSEEPVQPVYYTLTISQPTNGSISATVNGNELSPGSVLVEQGTLISLRAIPALGFAFSNWTGVPLNKATLQNTDFTIDSNTNILAYFTAVQYTVAVEKATDVNNVTLEGNNYPTIKINNNIQSNPVTVSYNTSVTLETPASIGNYNFTRWSDNNSTNRVRTLNIIADLTTHPIYTRPTYTVNFSSNSALGTITAAYKDTGVAILSGESVLKGSHITFTATPANGYELDSWVNIPSGSTYDDVVVNSALNISATFREVTPEHVQITVEFGERVNGVWTRFNPSVRVMLDNQQLLGNPYYVSDVVYLDGGHLTVDGYQFMQWEDVDHLVIEYEIIHKGANEGTHYFGTFAKEIELRVETNNEDGGTVSGNGTYVDGTIVSILANANEGYHFVKWSDNNTQNPRTITVNSNITTYTAIFALNNYTVNASVSPVSSGSISGLNNPYDWGTTCTITASSVTGYEFVGWTEGNTNVSSNATYEFTVNTQRTLVANFTIKKYTVTIAANPTAGGSASIVNAASDNKYEHGTELTLTQSANTGYTFSNWSGGTVTNNKITVTGPLTLKANFTKNTYTVSASVDPTGSGTVTVGGTANSKSISHGSTTTLVATASSGYTFVNWTLNGEQVATTASYTVPAITATVSYVAHFEETPQVDNNIYYFASENDDYSPSGKTINTLDENNATTQLNNVDTLVFLVPSTITITKIEDAQMGTDFLNKFSTHSVSYNSLEYIAYYYTDPDAYINGRFIVRY